MKYKKYKERITKKLNNSLLDAGGDFDPPELFKWSKIISQDVKYNVMGRGHYLANLEFRVKNGGIIKILFSCKGVWGEDNPPAEVYSTLNVKTDEVKNLIEKLALQIPPKNIFKRMGQYAKRIVRG